MCSIENNKIDATSGEVFKLSCYKKLLLKLFQVNTFNF